MSKRVVLLINMSSRKSRALKSPVLTALKKSSIHIDEMYQLNKYTDTHELLDMVRASQPNLVIVCGGDGTVNTVIGRWYDAEFALAIIPAGTTNNLARSLGIPLDVEDAVRFIDKHKARPIDVGRMNDMIVSNVLGIGVSASIASAINDKLKKRFGRSAYAFVGILQALRHKPFDAIIHDVDQEFEVHIRTHQLIVANGRFHGGKEIVEQNSVDNGQLIIFALGGRTRLGLMWAMLKFYATSRDDVTRGAYYIGRNVKIELSRAERVEVDGEVATKLTATILAKPVSTKLRIHRVS